ncbi:hypothetical protein [Amaricoccus sp.]|uniref:hypothetical protein n=1 Tax=Amaricoccus sp. TaxID=1872485 RepID=UPI001B688259|nr:hypothetical protein [Amaricoccus sp.]MBP6999909.1 hypothetical protein [Amaricoccus sp.]
MKRGGKSAEEAAMDEFRAGRLMIAQNAAAVSDAILDAAVAKLDRLFGAGYAKANPALVGAYLEATTRTFQEDMATIAEYDDDFGLELPPPDLDRRR